MTTAKYKVFIGCSTEARTVAQALRYELRDVADAELWSQGLFQVGRVVVDEWSKL
jgi:predicted nucleotide-binding protein